MQPPTLFKSKTRDIVAKVEKRKQEQPDKTKLAKAQLEKQISGSKEKKQEQVQPPSGLLGRDPAKSKYHLQFCLEWLHLWKDGSPTFKYNVVCVSELLKLIYEPKAINDADFNVFCEFLASNRSMTINAVMVQRYWNGFKAGKQADASPIYAQRSELLKELVPQVRDEVHK